MEKVPPVLRAGHVRVGVARSEAIWRAEHTLELRTLMAIPLDGRVRIETSRIKLEVMRQLDIPIFGVEVSRMAGATFVLQFDSQDRCNVALQCGALSVGHVRFQLLSWSRQVNAIPLSRYRFKIRVCIEGVPKHVRFLEVVAALFPRPSFVDDVDCDPEKHEEEECLRLWVWAPDLEGIPVSGTVQVEEPVTLPEERYAENLYALGVPAGGMRFDQAEVLDYEVLVHVDRVLDFAPLPGSPSDRS
jgi:hypothetical protein